MKSLDGVAWYYNLSFLIRKMYCYIVLFIILFISFQSIYLFPSYTLPIFYRGVTFFVISYNFFH